MPWHDDGASTARPTNVASGKGYRGILPLVLWVGAARAGYTQGLWGTYRACHAVGAQVRRGEKATARGAVEGSGFQERGGRGRCRRR
jgi:antirestriction protein ArdC